jgi:hypothetical protein
MDGVMSLHEVKSKKQQGVVFKRLILKKHAIRCVGIFFLSV